MSKKKKDEDLEGAAQIVSQVARILAAGERLRNALKTERWMERASSASANPGEIHRWLHTRVATDRAEEAYRQAIEECHRLAEQASAESGTGRSGMLPLSSSAGPTPVRARMFVGA